MRGRREIVGAVLERHPAQAPQRALHAGAQGLEALARTDRHRLPVRIRQHEVIQQVCKALPRDRHLQLAHVREVRLRLFTWHMSLREEHFLLRPRTHSPRQQSPLQRAQLPGAEATRMAFVQLAPDRLRLQARILAQQRFDLRPHRLERIGASAPRVRNLRLRRRTARVRVFTRRPLAHPRFRSSRHLRDPLR